MTRQVIGSIPVLDTTLVRLIGEDGLMGKLIWVQIPYEIIIADTPRWFSPKGACFLKTQGTNSNLLEKRKSNF